MYRLGACTHLDKERFVWASRSCFVAFPTLAYFYKCHKARPEHFPFEHVTCWVTIGAMIKSFRHKGLKAFYLTGSKTGNQAKHASRLRLILGRLDGSLGPKDMNLPGLRLHRLKGELAEFFAVDVSGNWRVIFKFEKQDAIGVDYLDYH